MTEAEQDKVLARVAARMRLMLSAIVDPRRERDVDMVAAEVFAISKVFVWTIDEITKHMSIEQGMHLHGSQQMKLFSKIPLDKKSAAVVASAPAEEGEHAEPEHAQDSESASGENPVPKARRRRSQIPLP